MLDIFIRLQRCICTPYISLKDEIKAQLYRHKLLSDVL
jgi:hypothetical protein